MSGEPSTATATPTPSTPPPLAKSTPDAERTLSRLRFWQALLVLIAAVLTFPLWPRQQTPPAAPTPERSVNIAVTVGNGTQNPPSPRGGAATTQSASPARPAAVPIAPARSTALDATATLDYRGRSACDPRQSVRVVWLEARDLYHLGSWQRALERFACANSKLPRDVKAATDQRSLSAAFAVQNATLVEYGQLASEVQELLEPARAALEQREWQR